MPQAPSFPTACTDPIHIFNYLLLEVVKIMRIYKISQRKRRKLEGPVTTLNG